jgi:DNA mismatch repair protein MutL
MYALFIDLDPAQLDINVHPTKQEIKFEDDKIVYAFVQSAVKHALAQFSITPTLDFELDASIERLDAVSKPVSPASQSSATSSGLYQTFTQKNQAHFIESKSDLKHWKDFYTTPEKESVSATKTVASELYTNANNEQTVVSNMTQLHNTYIIVQNSSGFLLVHQQNAHERVLYEKYSHAVAGKPISTQQSLFPSTIEMSPSDALLLEELLPDLKDLGYQLEPFGKNTFIIQGTPADIVAGNEKTSIENMLEQFKHFSSDLKFSKREKLFRSLALQHAVKSGTSLSQKEMQSLVSDLFNCEISNATPNGKPVYMTFQKDEMDKMFGR